MGGGKGGECGDPSQELLEVAERKLAAALVEEDGRKSVKRGVEWRKLEAWPRHSPAYPQIGLQQSGGRQGPAAGSDLSFKGLERDLRRSSDYLSLQESAPSTG